MTPQESTLKSKLRIVSVDAWLGMWTYGSLNIWWDLNWASGVTQGSRMLTPGLKHQRWTMCFTLGPSFEITRDKQTSVWKWKIQLNHIIVTTWTHCGETWERGVCLKWREPRLQHRHRGEWRYSGVSTFTHHQGFTAICSTWFPSHPASSCLCVHVRACTWACARERALRQGRHSLTPCCSCSYSSYHSSICPEEDVDFFGFFLSLAAAAVTLRWNTSTALTDKGHVWRSRRSVRTRRRDFTAF